jgi:predicted acetyltransferase
MRLVDLSWNLDCRRANNSETVIAHVGAMHRTQTRLSRYYSGALPIEFRFPVHTPTAISAITSGVHQQHLLYICLHAYSLYHIGSMFTFIDPGSLVDDDLQLKLIAKYAGDTDRGWVPTYRFMMTAPGSNSEMGNIELRIGNTHHVVMYAGHIGYRVHLPFRGHRYAARSCRLLIPLAQHYDLTPLWITCNPDNDPSRRTCEIVGAKLVEIVDLPSDTDMYREGERQKCRYRLDI